MHQFEMKKAQRFAYSTLLVLSLLALILVPVFSAIQLPEPQAAILQAGDLATVHGFSVVASLSTPLHPGFCVFCEKDPIETNGYAWNG